MIKLDSVKKMMVMYFIDKKSPLLQKYPLGFILFTIDKKYNIIPSRSDLTQVLDFNWDEARIEERNNNEISFQLPAIKYIRTDEEIMFPYNEVKIKNKQLFVKKFDGFGLNFSNLQIFFEIVQWNKYGILCLFGFKK